VHFKMIIVGMVEVLKWKIF